jgi:hypothetical protein
MDGVLTVEVKVVVSTGVLARVFTDKFGPDVERIIEVIISVKVVDGLITVEMIV